jgi:hypothetical protein
MLAVFTLIAPFTHTGFTQNPDLLAGFSVLFGHLAI